MGRFGSRISFISRQLSSWATTFGSSPKDSNLSLAEFF